MNGNEQNKPFGMGAMFPYLFMFPVFLFHVVPLVATLGKVAQWVKALLANQKVPHSNLTGCLAGLKDTTLLQQSFS